MKTLTKNRHVLVLLYVLLNLGVKAQTPIADSFSGYYIGLEIGTVSYNTQITFDGVNDPAGRGGLGYGAFMGYNLTAKKMLIGGELYYNLVKEPDPYTFDPGVIGFTELDIKRNANFGLDIRGGFFLLNRLLFYGSLGYSHNRQSILIDGVPLEQFSGGSESESFGRILLGFGLEVELTSSLTIRFSFEKMNGHDLDRSDFGIIATNASLQRLDVEPGLLQFFVGTIYRF